MTTVDEFCDAHGMGEINKIDAVVERWVHKREVDEFLATSVGTGVLLADLICGDGLQDSISPELYAGFSELMKDKAASYTAVRQILLEKLNQGDSSVRGLISKIQGQIGENSFLEHVGSHARLAASGSQEAWDVAVSHPDEVTQYVQVKTYSNANGVMQHIRDVQEKLAAETVFDGDTLVKRIDFAVSEDIVDEVQSKVTAAGLDVDVLTIPITSDEARQVVEEGVANVGPEALSGFFGELLVGTLTAAALHGAVNAFLVYKGAKDRSQFFSDTVYSTGITSGGLAAAFATEAMFQKLSASAAFLGGPPAFVATFAAGVTTRMYLSRVAERRDVAGRLADGNQDLASIMARLAQA